MIITQDELIRKIARKEDVKVSHVRSILTAADNFISDYLSSATPTNNVIIKLFSGLSLSSEYKPEKVLSKGVFKNTLIPERLRIKSKVTEHYCDKINRIFNKTKNIQ